MVAIEHSWRFRDIENGLGLIEHSIDGVPILDMPKIAVDDSQFLRSGGYRVEQIHADCFDIAAAIQTVDWWSVPASPKGKQRRLILDIPLRHPEIFGRPDIKVMLTDILAWETEDHWELNFRRRTQMGRPSELQYHMWPQHIDEVTLYSGGVDSVAGVNSVLLSDPNKILMTLTVNSHNSRLEPVVATTTRILSSRFPNQLLPQTVKITKKRSKDKRNNGLFRARGFAYLMIGAASAHLAGKASLSNYENMVGALNLSYRKSEVGIDHSRAVHPLTLLYMSRLMTAIFGTQFTFQNPFKYATKAEMCMSLIDSDLQSIIPHTLSCDRLGHNVYQCGCCSSCLTRRYALAYCGIKDETRYQTGFDDELLLDKLRRKSDFKHMDYQVRVWGRILASSNAWEQLSNLYPSSLYDLVSRTCSETGENSSIMISNLLNSLGKYVGEWQSISAALENRLRIYSAQVA